MQREKGAYAPVFYPAIILAIILSLSGIFYPNQFASHIQYLQNLILEKFGWAYILAMSVFLCLCLILMFSRFSDIKLGQEHDLPEYPNILWFAMLFAAGMGIGLMFYGVAEPLKHFLAPPNVSSDELVLVKEAMNTTFFHWGVEAWSVLSGLLAISLILAEGLQALQSATIISAFPLLFILFLMCVSLIKSLRLDYLRLKSIETHSTVVQFAKANTSWQKKLEAIAHKPSKDQAIEFLQKDVTIALIEVVDEMEKMALIQK